MWLIYNILFTIGYLVMLPHFLWRMCRRGGYRQDFQERFGCYAADKLARIQSSERVWIHAVSVGEAQLALAFIDELLRQDASQNFLISTTTSTGHRLLAERKRDEDELIYFPLDFPWVLHRVFRRITVNRFVLMECEIWPNMLRYLHRLAVPVFVVNGRISARSFRGYRRIRPFFIRAAKLVRCFMVQSALDEERLLALGVDKARVKVMGAAKYDAPPPSDAVVDKAREILVRVGFDDAPFVWVMGSTWPGEEAVLLRVFKQLKTEYPGLRAVLVPRHMERRAEVVRELDQAGLRYLKRTDMIEGPSIDEAIDVLLADTTGELAGYYAVADVVFVGKSMGDNHGGQNPIEPAMLGKPVITGPNMENFSSVSSELRAADAVLTVHDEAELLAAMQHLLSAPRERESLGQRAARLVASRQGVMNRTAEMVLASS